MAQAVERVAEKRSSYLQAWRIRRRPPATSCSPPAPSTRGS